MSTISYHKVANRISDEALRDDLTRVADIVGEPPKLKHYKEHGQYSVHTYRRRFGSWREALQEIGLEPHNKYQYSRKELKEEMRRVANEVGHPTTKKEMRDLGKFSVRPYINEFGGWLEAREAAGLESNYVIPTKKPVSEESLIVALQNLADELGHTPTAREMTEKGKYSQQTYQRIFDSWNEAVEAAGLEINLDRSGPYEKPYYGPDWHERRSEVLERDNHTCQSCGMTNEEHVEKFGSDLHVHHIHPIREFDSHESANKLSNLVTLCSLCHRKWEGLPIAPDSFGGRESNAE